MTIAGIKFHREFRQYIPCLIDETGRYKIVKYGNWCAYFLPKGWKNFGNSVRLDGMNKSVEYPTIKEAAEDCAKHLAKYPETAYANNRI